MALTPAELASRIRAPNTMTRALTPLQLRKWLVGGGFAVEHDGRLQATPLGAAIGGSLRPLEGA